MDPQALHRIRRTVKAKPEGSAGTTQILAGRLRAWLASKGTEGSNLAPKDASTRLAHRTAQPMSGFEAPRHSFVMPTSQLAGAEAPRRDAFGVRATTPPVAAPRPMPPPGPSPASTAAGPGVDASHPFAALTAKDRTKFAAAAAETPFFYGDLDDDPLPSSIFKSAFLTAHEHVASRAREDDFAAPHAQRGAETPRDVSTLSQHPTSAPAKRPDVGERLDASR